MIDVIYFGFSDRMMDELLHSELYILRKVVSIKGRTTANQYNNINKYRISYTELESSSDLKNLDLHSFPNAVIVMYGFDYILPQWLVDQFRIFNFHPGDLHTNRGRTPVVWSILNLDRNTTLSMYQLTGGIDEGLVIDEYEIPLTEEDNPQTITRRLDDSIPSLLLSLHDYLIGKRCATLVKNGIYNRRVQEADFTIDIEKDKLELICAKIRSQIVYKGAIVSVGGEVYRVPNYTKYNIQTQQKRSYSIKGNELFITENNICIRCIICKQ